MLKSLKIRLRNLLGLKTVQQLIRFLATGVVSTTIGYSAFLICLKIFNFHYLISNLIAFIASISFSYNCNKLWSFSGQHSKNSLLVEYLSVYLISFLISSAVLKITVEFMGIPPEFAFIISLCITTCFNFLSIKLFVFKK